MKKYSLNAKNSQKKFYIEKKKQYNNKENRQHYRYRISNSTPFRLFGMRVMWRTHKLYVDTVVIFAYPLPCKFPYESAFLRISTTTLSQ